jgi:hypothetical protein
MWQIICLWEFSEGETMPQKDTRLKSPESGLLVKIRKLAPKRIALNWYDT